MTTLFKITLKLFSFLALLALVSACVIATWVITGPRKAPYIAEQIEKTLSSVSPDYEIKVDNATVRWKNIGQPMVIYLEDVHLLDNRGKTVVHFPGVQVNLKLAHLLLGRIVVNEAIIYNSQLNFYFDISSWYSKGKIEIGDSRYAQFIIGMLSAIEKNGRHIPVRKVSIRDANFLLDNGDYEFTWAVPEWNTEFMLLEGGKYVAFKTALHVADVSEESAYIGSSGYITEDKNLSLRVKTKNFDTGFIVDFLPEMGWMSSSALLVNSEVEIRVSPFGDIQSANFAVASDPEQKPYINVKGTLNYPDNKDFYLPKLELNAYAKNVSASKLKHYWPPQVGVDAREWVVANVTEGTAGQARLRMSIEPEDFVSGEYPAESLDATVDFYGVKVDYMDNLPKLRNAQGSIHFDMDSVDITLQRGKINRSNVFGKASIGNMSIEPSMKIDGKLQGSVQDLEILRRGILPESKKVYKHIKGKADTEFEIAFPLDAVIDFNEVDFSLSSHLKSVEIADIYEGISATSGTFDLTYKDNAALLTGEALANNIPVKLRYRHYVDSHSVEQEEYNINTYLTPAEITKLGFPSSGDFLRGAANVHLKLQQNKAETNISGEIGGKEAQLSFPLFDWQKPQGVPANFVFRANKRDDDLYRVDHFSLTSDDGFLVEGTAEFTPDRYGWRVFFEKIKYKNNDLALRVVEEGRGSYKVDIRGKKWDAGPLLEHYFSSGSSDGEFHVDLQADIKEVSLLNGVMFRDVKAGLKCVPFCKSIGISAVTKEGGQPIHMLMTKKIGSEVDKKHEILFSSKDAGALLSGLGVYKNIHGGRVEITADVEGGKESTIVSNGKVLAKDFKVVKAPALAKLLALGSLMGLIDVLNGNGIHFDKLKGEFQAKDGVLDLDDFKASGNALGMTSKGLVNTKDGSIAIEGAVVPAYAINSVFGNIPLIGRVLVGKEGEGVLATNYSVVGNYDNPEVTVNPLSILTPGFLRGIWGGLPEKAAKPRVGQSVEGNTPPVFPAP